MAETLAGTSQVIYLGQDHCWQTVVPPNHWQKARPITRSEPTSGNPVGYALVACVVVPGFDFADFEISDA